MDNPYPLLERAEVLMNLRRYADARRMLRECLQIDPDFAQAHSQLAECLYHESKDQHREEALREAELAVSLAPDWAGGYYTLAWLEANYQHHLKALGIIGTAIELEPENAWLYYQRGFSYYHLDQYAEARQSFYKCLELDPEHHSALCVLSDIARMAGSNKLAVYYADKALQLAPEAPSVFVARGLAASASSAHKEADDLLREAVRLDPENEHSKTVWKFVRGAKPDIFDKYFTHPIFLPLFLGLCMGLGVFMAVWKNIDKPKERPSQDLRIQSSLRDKQLEEFSRQMNQDIQSSESLTKAMAEEQKKGEAQGLSPKEINSKKFIRYVLEKGKAEKARQTAESRDEDDSG